MARLLSELERGEFDITVIAIADTPPDVVSMLPDHVEVKHLKIDSTGLFELRRLIKVLKNTDILVCSLFHATAVGVPLGLLLRVPRILVWQHSTSYRSSVRSIYYRIAYRMADRVFADSEAVRSMLVNSIGVPEQKISTLPIAGVDTDKFRPGEQTTDDEIKIGTIGRLVEQKGYLDLLETVRQMPAYEFHVIGDGPQYPKLTTQAPENIQFHGRVDDTEFLGQLQEWDIYFQPSKYEGLCMTVIEAMACELPVVASSVGGITESVVPEETGYLCNPGEIDCFSHRLEQLGENPTLRDRMGTAGRKRVVSRYSQAELANQFRNAVKQTKTV
jgi:glycosyltransferase involved in cell wall biosynthesis